MHVLQQSCAGVGLLVRLNTDRVLSVGAITASLFLGGWLASVLAGF